MECWLNGAEKEEGQQDQERGAILDPKLKARLQKLADERDIFDYQALEEAVLHYLGEWELAPRDCRVPEQYRNLIDQVVEVLTSGGHPESDAAISLLRSAINVAHRLISPPHSLEVVGGRNEQPAQ